MLRTPPRPPSSARTRRGSLAPSALLALLLSLAQAHGSPGDALPAEPYGTATRLIERLFLEPERVDEISLLRAATRSATRDLHWLVARFEGRAVELSHGSGAPLGRVEIRSMEELPGALATLETLILASGQDLAGTDVRLSLLSGLADALDPYSRVLADERLDRFNVRLSGTLVGIGASLERADERLKVTEIAPGGPADLSGLLPGDTILRIDDRSTVRMPMSEAQRRLRGEEGTQVTLTISRPTPDAAPTERDIALTRAEIVEPNVQREVLRGNVGYLRIDHVSQRTVENLRRALSELESLQATSQGLILDLRGNTGGSMKESARVADVFLDSGLLLRTVGRDGGRVQNLQAEMYAGSEPDGPAVPIVVLVDDHTASGAEILAGALLELDRAALVGTRTYGKGTVQKIYTLAPEVRLKLTVARYILANERAIADGGIIPDVVVGQVALGPDSARLSGWDEQRLEVPWTRIVPEVSTGSGDRDLSLELARRAVLQTSGTRREDILASVRREALAAQEEQRARLRDALVARGLDWTGSQADGPRITARVDLQSHPVPDAEGDLWEVTAAVTNDDPQPLMQTLVQLDCRSVPFWDDLVIPIGRIEPGATASARVRVSLPAGVDPRQDAVDVALRADRRPALELGEVVLDAGSRPLPTLRVQASLAPASTERGPHGYPVRRAEIVVQNLSRAAISGLDVHFGYPGSDAVELLEQGARTAMLAGRAEERFELPVEIGPSAPSVLPLELVIEADRYGELVDWPLSLPLDGTSVPLQAPAIEARPLARSAPVGGFTLPITVTDDKRIDHVVVWVNGEKVAWAPGGSDRIHLAPRFVLGPGENRILVQTEDDQHIRAKRAVSVRGETEPESVDAGM